MDINPETPDAPTSTSQTVNQVSPSAQKALAEVRARNDLSTRLHNAQKALAEAETSLVAARKEFRSAIRQAYSYGVSTSLLADLTGLSRQRISQIVN